MCVHALRSDVCACVYMHYIQMCVCACVYMYYVQKTTFKRRVPPPSAMGQVLGVALGLLYFISDKGSACQDIIHY